MVFVTSPPNFDSSTYNPLFYTQGGDSLTLESAQLLFLAKNDYRISYLSGVTAGTASANGVLVCDSTRSISNINDIACSTVNGSSITNMSLLGSITPGFAVAGKALVVDANRDIATIRKISTSYVSPDTPWEAN